MQTTSELYQRLLRGEHRKETKAVIGGQVYTEGGGLFAISTSGALFEKPSIGNCTARQVDLTILPRTDPPRQGKIEIFVRLVSAAEQSEWLPKGVFYISTRSYDHLTGLMEIHGFDAMLKAEAVWLDGSYAGKNWPMPADDAVADIAERMGITVDPRTVLSPAFPVAYPVDGEGDMTMRQVLGRVAVANAGNWTITDKEQLLLVPLNSIPEEGNVLVTEHGDVILIGGYSISV